MAGASHCAVQRDAEGTVEGCLTRSTRASFHGVLEKVGGVCAQYIRDCNMLVTFNLGPVYSAPQKNGRPVG